VLLTAFVVNRDHVLGDPLHLLRVDRIDAVGSSHRHRQLEVVEGLPGITGGDGGDQLESLEFHLWRHLTKTALGVIKGSAQDF
jgi:hypothetical protein